MDHVPGYVVAVPALESVVRVHGYAQVLARALVGHELLLCQVAPGIVDVGVAPELVDVTQHSDPTVRPRVLGREQPIKRIVSKRLVAGLVTVVDDAVDIPVIAVAQMEVIAEVEYM